jgi:hypothetical protein
VERVCPHTKRLVRKRRGILGRYAVFDSLGKTVVVKLFVDAGPAQDCLEGFAIINGEGIENPVDGLVQESIDFTGTGPLYIRM